jgi:hypothetical protein
VRVIWGGDSTVSELRKSPISARATEITFADRYSLAVIDSEAYLENQDKAAVASGFYNDTYLSDQNACTSPRVVVWLGNHREEAREMFWSQICDLAEKRYSFQAIQGVDKLSQLYRAAVEYPGVLKEDDGCTSGNVLYRVKVQQLEPMLMEYRGNSGYFYEYDCGDVMELRSFCNNTHCQTIGLLGDASRLKPLLDSGIKGVDRVVPIGQTMNFDLIWDGYNLVEHMTRVVAV